MHVALDRGGFIAAALYVSNWYFLSQSQDYFAEDRDPSPVLHYWSLSVEEQFYLVWPLLLLTLVLLSRFGVRRLFGVVVALTFGGVVYTAWLSSVEPMSAYFGTLARAYQLLAGAAIGLWVFRRQLAKKSASDGEGSRATVWLAPLGLALLLMASTTFWGDASVFARGVIGCFGAGLLLIGFETNPGSRLAYVMSRKVPRRLGDYSYSMYLWHWPVIALASTVGILPSNWMVRVLFAVPLTIGLAAATRWLVEKPIQSISLSTIRARRRVALAGPLTAVGAAAFLVVALPISAHTQELIDAAGIDEKTISGTQVEHSSGGDPSDFSLMIVGDSHAGFWTEPMRSDAENRGWSLTSVHDNGCPWPRVPSTSDGGQVMPCDEELRDPAIETAKEIRPDVVLLISHAVVMRPVDTDAGVIAPGDPGWLEEMSAGSARFVNELRHYAGDVVIMQVIPQTKTPMIDCLSTDARPAACDAPVLTQPGTTELEGAWTELASAHHDVSVIDLDDLICPDGECPSELDGLVTFRDENHLTEDFAATLVDDVFERMAEADVRIPRTLTGSA